MTLIISKHSVAFRQDNKLLMVKGNVVQHSLNVPCIPEQTLNELTDKAIAIWSQPWLSAIPPSIQTRSLAGTPIAEYAPDTLEKGCIALVGDVAHLPAQLTASGFNALLQEAASLAECVEKGIQG